MRKGWVWVSVILLLIVFIGCGVGLYFLGGSNQSALQRLTDISIIFITLSMVLVVLLMGVLVGLAVWISLLLKNHAIPLLEQLTGTVTRVRGTTEFMTEEVASPVISFFSRVAGVRALVKTVTRGKRR